MVHVDWYTQAEFVRGEEYVDADGELCLVYAGILPVAAVRGLPGITDDVSVTNDESEPVLVFVVKQNSARVRFYCHTKADADLGYSFIPLDDAPRHSSPWITDPQQFED